MGSTDGTSERDVTSGGSRRGRIPTGAKWSVALVLGGVLAMVVPGLLRDGVCGLVSCGDVTPDVAVGRPSGSDLEVVIPPEAATELRSLWLTEIVDDSSDEVPDGWIVYRTDDSVAPTRIVVGTEPDGFDTRTGLGEPPTTGTWVLDASFDCASTVVRFSPEELDPGYVTNGDPPVRIDTFEADARSALRCATEAPGWQRWLFILGAASASVGAVMGIWVMMRQPVDDEEDWYAPDDTKL